jgi:hypothetical protein
MFTLCSIKSRPNMPTPLTPSYHWTPPTQRRFLEVLAQTGSIKRACGAVSMSRQASYAFRRRKDALAFSTGWDAAILVARAEIEGAVMEAALGQIEMVQTRNPETRRIGWRRADPWLGAGMGMSLLNRLDRSADTANWPGERAARVWIASSDFDALLDLIGNGGDGAALAAFMADRDAAANIPIQCQLPEKSAISEMAISSPLAHRTMSGHRATSP